MKSKGRNIFAAVFVSVFAMAAIGVANTTNVVPWSEDFEGYAVDDSVVGSNGWYAGDTEAAVIALNGADQILSITADVTNMASSTIGEIVYVDTMIDARPWDQEEAPTPPSDAQTAAYVNTNGNLVIWHGDDSGEESNRTWTVLENTNLAPGQWFRLTFKMDYENDVPGTFNVKGFSVIINGNIISNSTGTAANTAGKVFFMANQGTEISSVSFGGTADIDDFQYASDNPNPPQTENRVPYSWYTDNGIATNDYGNPDGDSADNWEEYVAGTDPNDTNSIFQILDITYDGDSNSVTYYSTASGSLQPVTIFRTTDLNGGWTDMNANVPRAPDGTNTWWDTNLPAGDDPVFYKPVIIWSN